MSERESDSLHDLIQAHFGSCRQCQSELDRQKKTPNRFGKTTGYCNIYLTLVETYVPPNTIREP